MKPEYFFVITAGILYGTITAGGQFFVNLGFSVFEISIFSVMLTSIILSFIVFLKPKYRIKKKMIFFFLIFGLINAMQEITQFGALSFGTPVAIVALLLYSQPVWTTFFGRFILKEKITAKKITAIIIAIIGIILVLKIWDMEAINSMTGIILAFLGGIFLSLWVILGRKSGIEKQHHITTGFGCFIFTLLWLVILWPITIFITNESSIINLSLNFPIYYWFYFLIFALLSGVFPHLLFYKGLQKVQASIAGIILLLEPVSATILAFFLFSQAITSNILIGGALILLSNYIVINEENK